MGPPFIREIGSSEVQLYNTTLGGQECTFVDIPGFSDTERSESETVRYISKSLLQVPDITGILYLHRISDDRMLGSSVRHLRVFHALCGSSCMRNVLILTTHWDRTPREVGETREKELYEHFWNELIEDGASVMRFDTRTPQCAQFITTCLMRNQPLKLAIQEQMEQRLTFEKTDVGRIINAELQRLPEHDQLELHPGQEGQAHHHGGTTISQGGLLTFGKTYIGQRLHPEQESQDHDGTATRQGRFLKIFPGRVHQSIGRLKSKKKGMSPDRPPLPDRPPDGN